jgi:hypothetical protein
MRGWLVGDAVFVIRNQNGLYLTRHNEWQTGDEPATLFKTLHRDIALNTLIELNAKDIELRGAIVDVATDDKGLPHIESCDMTKTTDLLQGTSEHSDNDEVAALKAATPQEQEEVESG